MRTSLTNYTAVLGVALWLFFPGHLEAKNWSGKAIVPADQASRQEIFTACQDMVINARYSIESIDAKAGLITARSIQRPFENDTSITITWNIIVRSDAEKQMTEIRMAWEIPHAVFQKGLDESFVYLFETMGLELSEISVTIGEETRSALDWKEENSKKKKRKKSRRMKGEGPG